MFGRRLCMTNKCRFNSILLRHSFLSIFFMWSWQHQLSTAVWCFPFKIHFNYTQVPVLCFVPCFVLILFFIIFIIFSVQQATTNDLSRHFETIKISIYSWMQCRQGPSLLQDGELTLAQQPEMNWKIVTCHCLYQTQGVLRDFVWCNKLWKTDQVGAASLLLLSSGAREDKWHVVTSRDMTCPVGTRGHFTQKKSLRQVRDGRRGLLMIS